MRDLSGERELKVERRENFDGWERERERERESLDDKWEERVKRPPMVERRDERERKRL